LPRECCIRSKNGTTDPQIRRFAPGGQPTQNGRVQINLLAPRTLALFGPLLAEDADQLLDAIASVGPGGPISLNLTGVTSIDEGGIAAIRLAATSAHGFGGVLILLLPTTETLDQVRGSGLDEEPLILVEVLET
jgi:ABC-type transporter Mla MlaB component